MFDSEIHSGLQQRLHAARECQCAAGCPFNQCVRHRAILCRLSRSSLSSHRFESYRPLLVFGKCVCAIQARLVYRCVLITYDNRYLPAIRMTTRPAKSATADWFYAPLNLRRKLVWSCGKTHRCRYYAQIREAQRRVHLSRKGGRIDRNSLGGEMRMRIVQNHFTMSSRCATLSGVCLSWLEPVG